MDPYEFDVSLGYRCIPGWPEIRGTSNQPIYHQLVQGLGVAHTSIPSTWEIKVAPGHSQTSSDQKLQMLRKICGGELVSSPRTQT